MAAVTPPATKTAAPVHTHQRPYHGVGPSSYPGGAATSVRSKEKTSPALSSTLCLCVSQPGARTSSTLVPGGTSPEKGTTPICRWSRATIASATFARTSSPALTASKSTSSTPA